MSNCYRVLAVITLLALQLCAPTATPAEVQPAVTVEQIQAKLGEVENATDLDDVLKQALIDAYRLAEKSLNAAATHKASTEAFRTSVEKAPAEAKLIRRALAQSAPPADALTGTGIGSKTPIAELEQRLLEEEAALTTLESKLAEYERRLHVEQARPDLARQELSEAKEDEQQARTDIGASPRAGEPPTLTAARRVALSASALAHAARVESLEQELLSHGVRLQLLAAQKDLAARDADRAGAKVKAIRSLINAQRRADVRQLAAEAKRAEEEATGKHPLIRALAEENTVLGRTLGELAEALERTSAEREATTERLKQLEQDFESARHKLTVGGLTEALGQILLDQRRRLPDVRRYRAEGAAHRKQIAALGLQQLKTEERRRALSDLDAAVAARMESAEGVALADEARREVDGEVRALLRGQQELLATLALTEGRYLRALGDLDFEQRQLVRSADQYAAFLGERLLWTPSASPLGLETPGQAVRAAGLFLNPSEWAATGRVLALDAGREPYVYVLAFAAFVALLFARQRLIGKLASLAEAVAKPLADRFGHTLKALLITLALAAPWPLLMAVVGGRLRVAPEATDFAEGIGQGLVAVVVPLLLLQVFRVLCRPRGVAVVHLGWNEMATRLLRAQLWWLRLVAVPAVFVAASLQDHVDDVHRGSLGRLAFMVAMIALAVFLLRVLKLRGGALSLHLAREPHGWLSRLRYLWYPLAGGIPLAVAGLAAIGYYYTAAQIGTRFGDTFWLLVGATVVHDLTTRWLMVARGRLAIQQARERRAAVRSAQATQEAATPSGDAAAPIEPPEVDLATIDAQSRQLLRTAVGLAVLIGLWLIWGGMFPALAVIGDVTLWEHTVTIGDKEELQPITLASVAIAAVIAVITAGAARNLPGALEIVLLQRLEMEHGSRHAVITVSQYAIVTVGIIAVLNTLGVRWSQVQWLVAALGVGLGFGLQEIFGNFMSGLIILLERPIRIGDTVTVGNLSGTVTQIRIRATTILDWDNKEIIVPNKAFITEQVINWTLSDPITRVVVPVGVAYGSDTALVHRVILETAKSLPLVLEEPAPTVLFLGFGDSSLDFEVRVFVRELTNRLPAMHELHMAIERALREHDIEIPFPQRDLHLRSGFPAPP